MVELTKLNKGEKEKPSKEPKDAGNQERGRDSLTEKEEQYTDSSPETTSETLADNDALGEGDVVRAATSKVALRGLKVVGKIDLPQEKQKSKDLETSLPTTSSDKSTKGFRTGRHQSTRKHVGGKPRKTRTSTAYRKKKSDSDDLQQIKKERRKQHYYEKINNYQLPIKPLKKQDDADYEVYKEEEDRPKSWLSRLIHWLTV